MSSLPFEGNYPHDDAYWPPAQDASLYPLRYGDLCLTPDSDQCRDSRGKPWTAIVLLHPSCELQDKGADRGVQVARVHKLTTVSTKERQTIITGYVERDGVIRYARVNTVYLAPTPDTYGTLNQAMFIDLRDTARVALDSLMRIAPLSHDARLAVIRREIYFKYRWTIGLEDVMRLEKARIVSTQFDGPKPAWL